MAYIPTNFSTTAVINADTLFQNYDDEVQVLMSDVGNYLSDEIVKVYTETEIIVTDGIKVNSVETIEDLATQDGVVFKTIIVKDLNRGGTFIWSATGTANGGTVFAGVSGFWNRQYDGAVSVKWFGAKGDGVTDDSVAFNSLKGFLRSGNSCEVLLPDTYNLPNGIIFNRGTEGVTFNGLGSGEIHSTGATNHALWFYGVSSVSVVGLSVFVPRTNYRTGGMSIVFQGCSDIYVSNCKTDGGVAGIWARESTDVLIENCIIDTPKADGIHFANGSLRCKAINNTVIGAGDDSFAATTQEGSLRTKDIVFQGNIVKDSLWGFGVSLYSVDNSSVVGNTFLNTALGGVLVTTYPGSTTQSNNCIVSGNIIDGSNNVDEIPYMYWNGTANSPIAGFETPSAISITCNNILVSENKISNVGLNSPLMKRGLTVYGCTAAKVSNNLFYNIKGEGIFITARQPLFISSFIDIESNTFNIVTGKAISCYTPVLLSFNIINNIQNYIDGILTPSFIHLNGIRQVRSTIKGNVSNIGGSIISDTLNLLELKYDNDVTPRLLTYTPIVTAASGELTSYTINSSYAYKMDKLVYFSINVTIEDSGTSSNRLKITLPYTTNLMQAVSGVEYQKTGKALFGRISSNFMEVKASDNSYPFITGSKFVISGTYVSGE